MKIKRIIGIFMVLCIAIGSTSFMVKNKNYIPQEKTNQSTPYRNGDIIFQSTKSAQSMAVEMVTKSKFSHCGLIFNRYNKPNDWWVLEGVQPVSWSRLSDFIANGNGQHYVVKRLKDNALPDDMGEVLQKEASAFLGKSYDLLFDWSDEKIYCSELVWKSYKNATGLEVGQTQQLKDFDLSHPSVAKIVKQRYGKNVPWEQTVISPQAIAESNLLMLVEEK